jgi:hypothetical protein
MREQRGVHAGKDRDRQAAFGRDLLELIERGNRSGDGTMVVPSEYLEVVIERNR